MMKKTFSVKVKNKLDGNVFDMDVRAFTQQEAEDHVAGLPGAFGGKHPGLEVIPAKAEPEVG